MKKNKYYICPQCGNITVCTGDAEVSCCGRKLTAATPVKAAEEQKLSAEIVEDEWFISGSCPMTKNDCISIPFDKKPSGITCIPPSNDALKPLDGTIQTKKRLGYPNRFFLVSTKKHRSESERCLVREMGLEPTRQRHTHLKRACLPIPALSHIF